MGGRILASILILSGGCATVPDHPHDADAQRLKAGSVAHAYGGALVVGGVSTILGAGLAGGAVIAGTEGDIPTGAIIAIAVGVGLGGLLAGLGAGQIARGNALFTPPPALAPVAVGSSSTAIPLAPRPSPAARPKSARPWDPR